MFWTVFARNLWLTIEKAQAAQDLSSFTPEEVEETIQKRLAEQNRPKRIGRYKKNQAAESAKKQKLHNDKDSDEDGTDGPLNLGESDIKTESTAWNLFKFE